jgi:alpha-galactosidase
VESRDFWREADVSPKNQGYHYNRNAETYMEVGNALGWAMAELLKGK